MAAPTPPHSTARAVIGLLALVGGFVILVHLEAILNAIPGGIFGCLAALALVATVRRLTKSTK